MTACDSRVRSKDSERLMLSCKVQIRYDEGDSLTR